MTFDYLMLVVISSVIAAAGLATDSSVTVVASMLVSPLVRFFCHFLFRFFDPQFVFVLADGSYHGRSFRDNDIQLEHDNQSVADGVCWNAYCHPCWLCFWVSDLCSGK